mmetsp:Transcript_12583/g.27727  ORF Transcript_12583/g.27727 Transcript_12583/m.27727 type:complete len:109 (+) Transcript_12583:422-748(+)
MGNGLADSRKSSTHSFLNISRPLLKCSASSIATRCPPHPRRHPRRTTFDPLRLSGGLEARWSDSAQPPRQADGDVEGEVLHGSLQEEGDEDGQEGGAEVVEGPLQAEA